jgi:integrase
MTPSPRPHGGRCGWKRPGRDRGTAALPEGSTGADRLLLGAGYKETGYVLVDALGEPLKPYTYSDHFEILCRKAGVPVVQLHSVGHSLALIMHQAGIPPVDAAAFLGHTVAVHLARYVPLTERGARAAASELARRFLGSGDLLVTSNPQPAPYNMLATRADMKT